MTLDNVAANSGSEQPTVPQSDTAVHVAGGSGPMSLRDAARSVIDWRRKQTTDDRRQTTDMDAARAAENAHGLDARAETATSDPVKESAQGETQDAQQADSGDASPPAETESQDAAETLPPVEPPRSWSKEDKELFKALPRETQERLAERERSRDTDFSRRQQEATERTKALAAEHVRVEQARAQYEHAVPIMLANLQAAFNGDFADIKSMEDVQKLAVTDPVRYTQWDAAQKRIAAVQQEVVAVRERQAVESAQRLEQFRRREAELFVEKAPEFAKPQEAKKLKDGAVTLLHDLGFQHQELGELWRGEKGISIHDHRLHLLLRDGIKWRDAQQQARAKTAQAKPVPPVQRPGAAQGANAAREAQLKALNDQLDKSSGVSALRAAARLVAERRRSDVR